MQNWPRFFPTLFFVISILTFRLKIRKFDQEDGWGRLLRPHFVVQLRAQNFDQDACFFDQDLKVEFRPGLGMRSTTSTRIFSTFSNSKFRAEVYVISNRNRDRFRPQTVLRSTTSTRKYSIFSNRIFRIGFPYEFDQDFQSGLSRPFSNRNGNEIDNID